MATLCTVLFAGSTLLVHAYQVLPREGETFVSQLARAVFDRTPVPVLRRPAGTAFILVLAAVHGVPGLSSASPRAQRGSLL